MSDTLRYPSVPPKTLANDLSSTGTLIQLTECNDWAGNALTTADFNTSYIPATLINDSRTLAEFVLIDASTIANATTTGLLIYRRGLKYYAEGDSTDADEVTANKLAWTQGETKLLLGSNPPYMYGQFPSRGNDETITGLWEFPSGANNPTIGSSYVAPTTNTQIATKKYVDDIAIAGAPDATTTIKGIIEIATPAELAAGTGTGGTGAVLVPAGDSFTNTPAGAGDENKVPVLDAAGRLDEDFLPVTISKTADNLQVTTAPDSDNDAANKAYVDDSIDTFSFNFFGDGSDGNVTLGSNVTLTRDMFYDTLTLAGAYTISTAGYKIYAKTGIVRAAASTAKIQNNGGAGGAGTAGSGTAHAAGGTAGAAAAGVTVPVSLAGVAGTAGTGTGSGTGATNGNAGQAGTAQSPSYCSTAGANGTAGGDASGGGSATGGAGGTGGASTVTKNPPRAFVRADVMFEVNSGGTIVFPKPMGSSASGGTGGYSRSTVQNISPGGSGGSGGGGGVVWICAKTITDNGTGTMFEAKGGAGGAGGAPSISGAGNCGVGGSAGGNGGSGGVIIRIYKSLTGTATAAPDGGAGGAGSTGLAYGSGTAANGSTGATGTTGQTFDIIL